MAKLVQHLHVQRVADGNAQRTAGFGEREHLVAGGEVPWHHVDHFARDARHEHIHGLHAILVRQQLGQLHGRDDFLLEEQLRRLGRRRREIGVLRDLLAGGIKLRLGNQALGKGKLED